MTATMAFLRRDFLTWASYRMSMMSEIAALGVVMLLVYYVGNILGDKPDLIKQQSGSYVAFVLAGVAFMDIFTMALGTPAQAIRDGQKSGTLEPMFVAPVSTIGIAAASSLFKFIQSIIRVTIFIAFGIIALGFWHHANPLSITIVFIPALATFAGIGILSAASTILMKQGDPVFMTYSAFMGLMGGALFPVEVLPKWLQPLALAVPLTHALSGLREGLDGGSPLDVAPQVAILTTVAVILLPLSLWAFNASIRRAKREGSLGEY
jgi:ABC-2 type transport system permease protein